MDKQTKTATELEEKPPKVIIGRLVTSGATVHRNTEAGWHAMIHGRHPTKRFTRCQVMADTITTELRARYSSLIEQDPFGAPEHYLE